MLCLEALFIINLPYSGYIWRRKYLRYFGESIILQDTINLLHESILPLTYSRWCVWVGVVVVEGVCVCVVCSSGGCVCVCGLG